MCVCVCRSMDVIIEEEDPMISASSLLRRMVKYRPANVFEKVKQIILHVCNQSVLF